jgi:hypothetical protein
LGSRLRLLASRSLSIPPWLPHSRSPRARLLPTGWLRRAMLAARQSPPPHPGQGVGVLRLLVPEARSPAGTTRVCSGTSGAMPLLRRSASRMPPSGSFMSGSCLSGGGWQRQPRPSRLSNRLGVVRTRKEGGTIVRISGIFVSFLSETLGAKYHWPHPPLLVG